MERGVCNITSPGSGTFRTVSSCGSGPLAIAYAGPMAMSLDSGCRQVLGAEPLRLLLTARVGDATELDVPLGTAELCRGVDWAACDQGWEQIFCLSRCCQGSGHVPSAKRGELLPQWGCCWDL